MVCKTMYTGSIPVGASKVGNRVLGFRAIGLDFIKPLQRTIILLVRAERCLQM